MSILAAVPVIGRVLESVLGVVDNVVVDKDQRDRLKHELQTALLTRDYDVIVKELESRARIVTAEAQGESWLQRNWRPLTATMFAYIVFHTHVLLPVFNVPPVTIPDGMWTLLNLMIGGYVVSRGAEKGIREWKKQS